MIPFVALASTGLPRRDPPGHVVVLALAVAAHDAQGALHSAVWPVRPPDLRVLGTRAAQQAAPFHGIPEAVTRGAEPPAAVLGLLRTYLGAHALESHAFGAWSVSFVASLLRPAPWGLPIVGPAVMDACAQRSGRSRIPLHKARILVMDAGWDEALPERLDLPRDVLAPLDRVERKAVEVAQLARWMRANPDVVLSR